MNKENKPLIIGVSLIFFSVIMLVGIMYFRNNNKESSFNSISDVKKMVNSIYSNLSNELPALEYQDVNSSTESWKSITGLNDNTNVDFVVVSEPLMNAQAYSLVVLKVKDTSKIESMKQEMYDNINMSKWICVSAEKLYITNSDDIIFMVMASDDWATPVYTEFKKYVNNNIGKELTKTEDGSSIPGEMPGVGPVVD